MKIRFDRRYLVLGLVWVSMVVIGQNCTRVEFQSLTDKAGTSKVNPAGEVDDSAVDHLVVPDNGTDGQVPPPVVSNPPVPPSTEEPSEPSSPPSQPPVVSNPPVPPSTEEPSEPSSPPSQPPVANNPPTITLPEVVDNEGNTNPEVIDELEQYACGNGNSPKNKKVLICHVPPGNPANQKTKCLPRQALQAHLNHGQTDVHDYLGPCTNSSQASND